MLAERVVKEAEKYKDIVSLKRAIDLTMTGYQIGVEVHKIAEPYFVQAVGDIDKNVQESTSNQNVVSPMIKEMPAFEGGKRRDQSANESKAQPASGKSLSEKEQKVAGDSYLNEMKIKYSQKLESQKAIDDFVNDYKKRSFLKPGASGFENEVKDIFAKVETYADKLAAMPNTRVEDLKLNAEKSKEWSFELPKIEIQTSKGPIELKTFQYSQFLGTFFSILLDPVPGPKLKEDALRYLGVNEGWSLQERMDRYTELQNIGRETLSRALPQTFGATNPMNFLDLSRHTKTGPQLKPGDSSSRRYVAP